MVDESTESIPEPAKKLLSRSRRRMLLQLAAATMILVCGIVMGSGATLIHLKDRIIRDRRPPLGAIVWDIRTRYNLTEEQTEKVEKVLGQSREKMHELFMEFREKTEAGFKEISSAMKDILTPEQYEQWQNDFKSRRGPGPERFGPGGPGPGRRGPGGPGRFGAGKPGSPGPEHRRQRPRRPDMAEPNSGGQ